MKRKKSEEQTESNWPTFLEGLMAVHKPLADHAQLAIQTKKITFISILDSKIGANAKRNFIMEEIAVVDEDLKKLNLAYHYGWFNKPYSELENLIVNVKETTEAANAALEDKDLAEDLNIRHTAEILSQPKVEINESVFGKFRKQSEDLEETASFIDELLNKKNPLQAFSYAIFTFHYLRQYLTFLSEKLDEVIQESESNEGENNLKSEYTTARQVLAVFYLLDELGAFASTDKTQIARFIQFLTGRETGASDITHTNIYKRVRNILSRSDRHSENDLQFIRKYFEKLGLHSISDKITKEIASK